MKIDINKVNLLEKDIEDWLYENPEDIGKNYMNGAFVTRWIGRQYNLPSGIADLIGINSDGIVAVVEVKNVAINKAAILQVCRYAADIDRVISERGVYIHKGRDGRPYIRKIIVGPSIDGQTFEEALACDVTIVRFEASVELALDELDWSVETYHARSDAIDRISKQPEWDILGIHYLEFEFPKPIEHDIFGDAITVNSTEDTEL